VLWQRLRSQRVPAQGACRGPPHCLPVVVATVTSKALSFAADVMVGGIPYLILQAVDQKELYNLFFKPN